MVNQYEFIIFSSCYKPGTAPTNRLLSFLKGFDELGAKIKMIFAYPSKSFDIVTEKYQNIDILYLWENDKPMGKVTKFIKSLWRVKIFANGLKDGTKILLVGSQVYLYFFVKSGRLKVFHERTENPELINKFPFGLQRFYYRMCQKTECIFGISTGLCEFFQDKGVKNTQVINMTVDANRFDGLTKHTNEKYIAYCGTVSNQKDGVDILIRAFALISNRHPDVKLYIIGKFPKDKEKDSNLQLISDLGIKGQVVLTGAVPYNDMPQILYDASVLALARPNGEQARCGFPTKLGEYLLTGNPVVITSVGDIPRFLKNKENAVVCVPDSVSEFSNSLDWILRNESEARRIGQKGREVALREFNYKNEANKIYNIIKS